jgi:predicted nucleotidyltransferase
MNEVEQQVDRFLTDLDRAWPGGYAAVLFGSAARGQYLPGWSDINLLLVAEAITADSLRSMRGALERWREQARTLPLLFTSLEWRRSADAYPLEIAEMLSCHQVLRGSDPLLGMQVRPADLRAALEREFRGKLMRLRQGYALLAAPSDDLTEFVRRSASSVLLLCRGLLLLTGEPVPADSAATVSAAGRIAGFAPEAVDRIIAARADSTWRCAEEDMRGYLVAVETAAGFVDNFQIGART